VVSIPQDSWYYRDNGFASCEAMDQAHSLLLDRIANIPEEELKRVIDFGCGNGVLLKKIVDRWQGCIPYGLDVSAFRIIRAQLIHPLYFQNFEIKSMFDPVGRWLKTTRQFSLGIFMIGRLLEVPQRQRKQFMDRVMRRCKHVLVYFYGGWVQDQVNLLDLAERCGFCLGDIHRNGTAAFLHSVDQRLIITNRPGKSINKSLVC